MAVPLAVISDFQATNRKQGRTFGFFGGGGGAGGDSTGLSSIKYKKEHHKQVDTFTYFLETLSWLMY
jgi:hypothetical protein